MTITAKYPGRCGRCGGRIEPGQQIDWDKQTKKIAHVRCPEVRPTTKPAARPTQAPRKTQPARPAGPTIANGKRPYQVGEVLAARLTEAEIAELEQRQGVQVVEVPPSGPVQSGRRTVAVRVVWATALRSWEVEELDAWGERYQAVIELAIGPEAEALVESRRQAQVKAQVVAQLESIWQQVQERGTRREAQYGTQVDGLVWDGRSNGSGRALGVVGGRIIARSDTGYDMYVAAESVLIDAELAQRIQALAAQVR